MTDREREARDVKRAESAETRGTTARQSALRNSQEPHYGMPFGDGVEEAIRSLAEDPESQRVIQLVISLLLIF
jgi:hypothetical protein